MEYRHPEACDYECLVELRNRPRLYFMVLACVGTAENHYGVVRPISPPAVRLVPTPWFPSAINASRGRGPVTVRGCDGSEFLGIVNLLRTPTYLVETRGV
jgi:hypothetical protein